jgi:hypothetical protein
MPYYEGNMFIINTVNGPVAGTKQGTVQLVGNLNTGLSEYFVSTSSIYFHHM